MKINPEKIKPGDVVILDESQCNETEVIIISMSDDEKFSYIESIKNKEAWTVQTKRLRTKNPFKNEQQHN